MLALLLALSPGAVALQASEPAASPAANPSASQPGTDDVVAQTGTPQSGSSGNVTNDTTTVLTLGTEPTRTAFDRPSLALGSSLATDYDGFQTQLRADTLDEQLSAAETSEEQRQILNRYRYRIENRIISLQAEERDATQSFSNGTLSKSEYLRTLGQIDVAVAETRALIDAMQEHQSIRNMDTEAGTLNGQLVTLDGPVRDRIGRAVQGEAPPAKVYVATADTGVVLSTIADGEYVREIVRTDRRDPGASNQMTVLEAQQAIVDKHSWAYNNIGSSGIDAEYGATNVYQMWFDHSQGRLEAYYDGGTESVFKEVQRKQLVGEDSVPPGPGVVDSSDDLTLTVNRTYAGGPLRVRLTNETGAPLEGAISVDGESVGRTSEDGVLWTLGPAEQFRVGATYGDRSINVTTTPVDAP